MPHRKATFSCEKTKASVIGSALLAVELATKLGGWLMSKLEQSEMRVRRKIEYKESTPWSVCLKIPQQTQIIPADNRIWPFCNRVTPKSSLSVTHYTYSWNFFQTCRYEWIRLIRFQDETFSRVKLDSLVVEKGLAAKVIECFRESEWSLSPADFCEIPRNRWFLFGEIHKNSEI